MNDLNKDLKDVFPQVILTQAMNDYYQQLYDEKVNNIKQLVLAEIKKDIDELISKHFASKITTTRYGIQGDARDHLARSIAAWRKLNASAAPGNTPK